MPNEETSTGDLEEKFKNFLRNQLNGLQIKVENDFSDECFSKELEALKSDPVYPLFAFDTIEYVLIRLIGRVSVSIGRRLGEVYDKSLRVLAAARFKLTPLQVAPKLNQLELDIALRFSDLSEEDVAYVKLIIRDKLLLSADAIEKLSGIGIEIRYIFNPNDSSRLRKDVAMAGYVKAENLLPVYLVFSSISPRLEAIARLEKAGWQFLRGEEAVSFAKELFGLDVARLLTEPTMKKEIQEKVDGIMKKIFGFIHLERAVNKNREEKPGDQ